MKLYGSLTSPYVRKCRIVLHEKGIACEFVAASPGDAPVARLNPLGKVPVLEREPADVPNQVAGRTSEASRASESARGPRLDPIGDDGSALFDSPVIFEYLDSLKPPALLAASGEDRWQMLRLQALADGILDATVARMIELRRPPEQQSAKERQKQEEKVTRALVFAERHAAGAYLMQNKFTAADLCLAVALEYVDFRYAHDWRARHPMLARWLAGISARAAFLDTVPPGLERSAPLPH
jgi:glutathione S-transferase